MKIENTRNMTDNEIAIQLKNFIENVTARNSELLQYLDLRFIHYVTSSLINREENLQDVPLNIILNNILIFNLTNDIIKLNDYSVTDKLLCNVLANRNFIQA